MIAERHEQLRDGDAEVAARRVEAEREALAPLGIEERDVRHRRGEVAAAEAGRRRAGEQDPELRVVRLRLQPAARDEEREQQRRDEQQRRADAGPQPPAEARDRERVGDPQRRRRRGSGPPSARTARAATASIPALPRLRTTIVHSTQMLKPRCSAKIENARFLRAIRLPVRLPEPLVLGFPVRRSSVPRGHGGEARTRPAVLCTARRSGHRAHGFSPRGRWLNRPVQVSARALDAAPTRSPGRGGRPRRAARTSRWPTSPPGCGMAKPTLYRLAGSRDDLVRACVDAEAERLLGHLHDDARRATTPLDGALRAMARVRGGVAGRVPPAVRRGAGRTSRAAIERLEQRARRAAARSAEPARPAGRRAAGRRARPSSPG